MEFSTPSMLVNPFGYFKMQSVSLTKGQDYFLVNKRDEEGDVIELSFIPVDLPDHSDFTIADALSELKECDGIKEGDSVIVFNLTDVIDHNTVCGKMIPEQTPVRFHIPFPVLLQG